MNRNKKILTGLNHREYEHPNDKEALKSLEKTPGLKQVGSYITKHTIERIYTIQYTGSNIRVTKQNYPAIYEMLEYACHILNIPRIPDLYLRWGYDINGFTTGAEKPLIVLNSGVIDLCDDDEKLFIIGHECGHIKSMHMLYHMMAQVINAIINSIPGGEVFAFSLQYALFYWSRMSEYTADRAGLLCCQDKEASIRALMKMAGIPKQYFSAMSFNTFIEQAKEFDNLDFETMNKVIKFISIADDSHPWTVKRAAELLKWIDNGAYGDIINEY